MDGKLESGRFKNSLSTWSAQIYPVAKFITRQNFPRTPLATERERERERESHVARNFFLNRLSNIPFHVSSASFLTPRFSSDGRANVKQWKIFERSLPSSRFLPIFARELNNVFFSPFLLSLSLFFSFLLYANEFRSTGVGRQRTPSRKFQRVQTSDFSEGGYVVRALRPPGCTGSKTVYRCTLAEASGFNTNGESALSSTLILQREPCTLRNRSIPSYLVLPVSPKKRRK